MFISLSINLYLHFWSIHFIYLFLSICIKSYFYIYSSICLYLPIHQQFICLYFSALIYFLSIYLFIYLFIHLLIFIYLSVFIYLFTQSFIYYIHPFIFFNYQFIEIC